MASNFSSMGLKVKSKEDFNALLKKTKEKGKRIPTDFGSYAKWEMGNGFEFWGKIDKSDYFYDFNPHFSGNSRIKAKMGKIINKNLWKKNEKYLKCMINLDDEEYRAIPIMFDSPDIESYDKIKRSQDISISVSGIAYDIGVYEDVNDFFKLESNAHSKTNSARKELNNKTELFLPLGALKRNLFKAKLKTKAFIAGYVLDTKIIENEYSKLTTCWAKVKTLGGEIDILVDEEILERKIYKGSYVVGFFWLSGRILC